MSSSFGKWYTDQQAEQNADGATSSTSSWFDMEQGLPLFSTEGMPSFSIEGMRESMEASMPRKILGMGYQQRFQVGETQRNNKNENEERKETLLYPCSHITLLSLVS